MISIPANMTEEDIVKGLEACLGEIVTMIDDAACVLDIYLDDEGVPHLDIETNDPDIVIDIDTYDMSDGESWEFIPYVRIAEDSFEFSESNSKDIVDKYDRLSYIIRFCKEIYDIAYTPSYYAE